LFWRAGEASMIPASTARQRFCGLLSGHDPRKSGFAPFEIMLRKVRRETSRVIKRLTVLICLLSLGLALGGCSKCDVWSWQARACKADAPK
jgi:hypothetical protein